jgi:hypothetical protein
MNIGATCAGRRGQHVFWEYLSQGGLKHWGELSKGTVVQGRFKVVSIQVDKEAGSPQSQGSAKRSEQRWDEI